MDPLADLLDGVRARTAAFCHTVLEPPWSMRIVDEAPISLATVVHGHAWLVPDEGEPTRLDVGDVAVIKGPHHYTVADDPATPPSVLVHAGNRLTALDGTTADPDLQASPYAAAFGHQDRGVPEGGSLVVSGAYQLGGDISGRLLAALPHVAKVTAAQATSPVFELLGAEVDRAQPGQQVMLDRLLDLALIFTLRAWFNNAENEAPGWYRAQSDEVVGPALRTIHDDPSKPWTVASLAHATGSSRAAFARRFTELVGQPPMTYLTHWRLARAADLLRNTDATVESIAQSVGYANGFALTVAFKRVRGLTPRQHRAGAQPRRGYVADESDSAESATVRSTTAAR